MTEPKTESNYMSSSKYSTRKAMVLCKRWEHVLLGDPLSPGPLIRCIWGLISIPGPHMTWGTLSMSNKSILLVVSNQCHPMLPDPFDQTIHFFPSSVNR